MMATVSTRWLGVTRAPSVPAAAGGGGRWELHGGTGKYAAVTGSCTYQTQYLDDGWLVATGTCEWSRDAST